VSCLPIASRGVPYLSPFVPYLSRLAYGEWLVPTLERHYGERGCASPLAARPSICRVRRPKHASSRDNLRDTVLPTNARILCVARRSREFCSGTDARNSCGANQDLTTKSTKSTKKASDLCALGVLCGYEFGCGYAALGTSLRRQATRCCVSASVICHFRMYFQFHGLPSASHSRAVARRFSRVASCLASVIHSSIRADARG
jgi:hypothetical protein